MKNIFIIIVLFLAVNLNAQEVKWIPSSETDDGCSMVTDCKTNTLCFSLELDPTETGTLTSYTTGFLTSCLNGSINVLHNQSCVINDNSMMTEACAQFDRVLLNCSGNTGNLAVTQGQKVILHQICFEMDIEEEVVMEEDPVMGITISYDLSANEFATSVPKFDSVIASTRRAQTPCDEKESTSLDTHSSQLQVYPNPTAGGLKVFFNDGGKNAALSILSTDNRRVLSENIRCNRELDFDLEYLKPGTYIVNVKGQNKTESKKFIILK